MSHRYRPSAATAERVAQALDAVLPGHHLDKIYRPEKDLLFCKVSGLGGLRLFMDVTPAHVRVGLTTRRPETPDRPDRTALVFRQLVAGKRFRAVELIDQRALRLHLGRPEDALWIQVQLAGRYPNAAIVRGGEVIGQLREDRPPTDDASPPLTAQPDPWAEASDEEYLSVMDAAVWALVEDARIERRRLELARGARAFAKKQRRKVKAVEADLERAEGAEQHRHEGELLKTVLGRVQKGQASIEVRDWSGEPVTIALDPALDVVANMERRFKLYRKLRGAREQIEVRLLEALEVLERVDAVLADLDTPLSATTGIDTPLDQPRADQQLDRIEGELRAQGAVRKRRAPPRTPQTVTLPYRRFRANDGIEILVGRSSKHNDALTFGVARGNDVWLHARDVPGSHVVLRTGRSEPTPEALLDAATLAAWHSKARGAAVVDVTWTRRKHVRKPPAAPPGRVTVAGGRTLSVRIDAERLRNLYLTTDDSG